MKKKVSHIKVNGVSYCDFSGAMHAQDTLYENQCRDITCGHVSKGSALQAVKRLKAIFPNYTFEAITGACDSPSREPYYPE